MELNLSDIKDIAIIAKPFIDPIITTMISPKIKLLEKWVKKQKTQGDMIENFFESKFTEYLNRSYQKFSTLNILVFPNQQINIKSIYLPLSIRSTKDYKEYKIDLFKQEFIEPYQRIVISDTAGMGKSTLMKWIGLSLIEQKLSIPILIELKKLNDKHSIIDEIYNQLDPIDQSFDKDLVIKFLELGGFTILLDGFDEIQYEYREKVIIDLKDFVSKASKNWFILTSRPDSSLTSFGEFQMFHITPLGIEESFELIKKYDSINKNKVSDQLIKNIKEKDTQVREFLVNPFLVSLLYKTYTYNKDLPSKKSTFYDDVYGALYKHHDLSKDGFKRNKKSNLDIQDFRLVLRQLAYDTAKIVKVEYNEQDLVKYIHEAKVKCVGLDFKENDFIEDIEANVPLFVREGSILKWAHKSLQDYFAAEFIGTSKDKEKIIQLIYESRKENYLNIIDFLYEIEYKSFRKIIVGNIVRSFINYCENTYRDFNDIKEIAIRDRQAISFGISHGFYLSETRLEFSTIRKKFEAKIKEPMNQMISRPVSKKEHFFQIMASTYEQGIINILISKNEPIFRIKNAKNANTVEKIVKNLPKNKAICFDDDINNPINVKEIFDVITDVALSQGFMTRPYENHILDYEKCKVLLDKIEKENAIDEQKDTLAGI
ncbi:NACHT domain-containing protein [Pedobacter frigiditerrae]|uniref:NACHT domain-containing protein n=1 Tax=Pedobacter frigiditerrae TaxID=2530452 RepID=UPI00292EE696|nr:NACHT domain-containing protein [Pedobacter frigiditerrae]